MEYKTLYGFQELGVHHKYAGINSEAYLEPR